jgi:hypothetical protein
MAGALSLEFVMHRPSAGVPISDRYAMLLSIIGGWLWNLTGMPIPKLRAGRAVRHRHCRLGVGGEECAAMRCETGRVV